MNSIDLPPPQRRFDSRLRRSNQAYLQAAIPDAVHPPISRCVGFLLLEHFSMMAFTAAVDALVTANLLSRNPLYRFRILGVDGAPVRSDLGIAISVDGVLGEVDAGTLDMLVVCGGYRSSPRAERPVVELLRRFARQSVALGGIWNGSCLLAHAGLLDGYACTVHPESRAGLQERHLKVKLLDRAWVIDRNRVSCAGASSALGMMLAVIRHQHGDEVVSGIEEILACDRTRDDQPEQPMPVLAHHDPALPPALRGVLELMENNIEEPLGIDELARHASLSRRRVDRLFQRYLQATPSRYYLELRLTRARRLLMQTDTPVTEVAIACGFSGAPHFSRCYRDFFGQSPSRARQSARALR